MSRWGLSPPVHPTTPHSTPILPSSLFSISCLVQRVAEFVTPLPESDIGRNLPVFLSIDRQRAGMENRRRKPPPSLLLALSRQGIQGLTTKVLFLVYLNLEVCCKQKV